MTVNKMIEKLLTLENEGYGDFPLIYSKDDEGNSYGKVYYEAEPKQVKDLNNYDLELMWDEDGENEGSDYNCVLIN